MGEMFNGASSFDQPLDSWDVSSVIGMDNFFNGASSFNQPLNSWDVSSVRRMYGMFDGASSFQQCLDVWEARVHHKCQGCQSVISSHSCKSNPTPPPFFVIVIACIGIIIMIMGFKESIQQYYKSRNSTVAVDSETTTTYKM